MRQSNLFVCVLIVGYSVLSAADTIAKNNPVWAALDIAPTNLTLTEIGTSPDNNFSEVDAADFLQVCAAAPAEDVMVLHAILAGPMHDEAQVLYYLDLDNDSKTGRQNVLAGTDVILLIKNDTNSIVYFNNAMRGKIAIKSYSRDRDLFLAVRYAFPQQNGRLILNIKALNSERTGGKGDRINNLTADVPFSGAKNITVSPKQTELKSTTATDTDRDGISDAVEQVIRTPQDVEQVLMPLQAQTEQDEGIITNVEVCHVGGYRLLLKIACSDIPDFQSAAQALIYLDIDNDRNTGRQGVLDGCDSLMVINKEGIKFLYWNSAYQNKCTGAFSVVNNDVYVTLDCPWPEENNTLPLNIVLIKIENFNGKNPAWIGIRANVPYNRNSALDTLGGAPKAVKKIKELSRDWQSISAPQDKTTGANVIPQGQEGDWKFFSSGEGELSVLLKNNVLFAEWSGGSGEAILEPKICAPVLTNSKKQVRYICELNIVSNAYGGQVFPQLLLLNEKGNPCGTEYDKKPMYASGSLSWTTDPQYNEAPGSWGVVDFQKTITADVSAVRPRFVLRGNHVLVAIGRMRVEPVAENIPNRRPDAVMEKRDFTKQESDAILAKRVKAQPVLVRKKDRVALTVNGQDVFPAIYTRGINFSERNQTAYLCRCPWTEFKFGV